jgi:DNA repair protein RadC
MTQQDTLLPEEMENNTAKKRHTQHYQGHRKRLRARLVDAPEKLQDYEILELLLGYVILRRDTKPIAKELLARFGSLRGVMEAPPERYLDIPGIGEGVAGLMALLREVTPRYVESRVRKREELCSPEAVAAMARERLGRLAHEEIWVAYVDNSQRLVAWERAVRGTYGTAPVNARDIVERGLLLKATGVILVHNHPGGNAKPSGADANLTRHLEMSTRTVGIRFVDHVIVTDDACYSMMSEGFL